MIARMQREKASLALGTTLKTLQLWNAAAKSGSDRILGPVFRFGGGRMKAVSRLWQSLALARRFYPTTQISSPEPGSGVASFNQDSFDPLLVRALPRKLHALIRFRVAIRIGSSVRADEAAFVCQSEGWSPEQLGAASAGYDWSAFSEVERLVLRYTDDLTRTPMDVDMDTLRSLKRNLTSDQLLELAASIAQENFKARFQAGVGVSRELSEPAA
jgi:hypothetical protein